MWCKRCGYVLGVKNTHRVRNTGCLLGSAVVPGAYIFGKVEGYYCPKCGARVHPAWMTSEVDRIDTQSRIGGSPQDETAPLDSEKDEAYWDDYVERVTGKRPQHVTMTTSDGKWITHDDGETYTRTAQAPLSLVPAPPPVGPPRRRHRFGVSALFAQKDPRDAPPPAPPAP